MESGRAARIETNQRRGNCCGWPNFDEEERTEMDNSIPLLIVEDNPVSLRLMERVLGSAGYKISSAKNGIQASNILRSSSRTIN